MFSLVANDFIEHFEALRDFADRATFADMTSPVDGVVYPNICLDVPDWVRHNIVGNLEAIFGCSVDMKFTFMRLSPKGVHVPHPVHTDASMAKYSLMLYLNRAEHCQGGTSLLQHTETGMTRTPRNEAELELWKRDMRDASRWSYMDEAKMAPNRAFIFDADLYHRAEPEGGFGTDNKDARLVLTTFFDLVSS